MISRTLINIGLVLTALGLVSFIIGAIIRNPILVFGGYGTMLISPVICIWGIILD